MAIEFDEILELAPIPKSRQRAVSQTLIIQRRLTTVGGITQVKAEALAAINNTALTDPPSEAKRLRILYKDIYTQHELTDFVSAGLSELGFHD
ncbi:MAG: hypothetical protein AAGE59_27160 [Cyanobacteria bacterium P01_F01_bin.86]